MEEQTYLKADDVLITSSRIQIGPHLFATRNVAAVRVDAKSRPRWPFVMVLLGLILFGLSIMDEAKTFGLILAAMGAAAAWKTPARYALVLLAGGAEVVALQSRDTQQMRSLHQAVAQAIAAR